MSGDKIGFLDPHKQCFEEGRSGAQYDIQSNLLEGDSRDQFKPFKGVFDFDFSQNYQSTLFRFPLRTCPSKLSQTQYTKEKIDMLFESLREEASIILLFMKNIQHISVYERMEGDKEVKCIFTVEIAPEMCETVKQERQEMLESAVEGGVTESLSYIVDFCFSSKSEKKCFKWLVLNQIGLERDERIAELSENLSLLPWVGCAVPLNRNAQKEDMGRIFCFLPLPHDVDCQTGLPILVHGAFGVTDNRRGLLWPGSECQNNETAEWNVLLVEKILSSVVYNAVKSLINDSPNSGLKENQRRKLVYSTLPELRNVKGHWDCLLDPLFQKLKHLNLFLAQTSSCTSWITLQDGLLDQMKKSGVSEKTRNVVLETLRRNSQTVITGLPDHVNEIVDKYFGKRKDITSEYFRNFLRNYFVATVSRDDKLMLLDYILHDNPQPEKLSGIPLLPLVSGGFGTFSEHCHDSNPSLSVLVSDASCTEDLLPNMEDRFLDKKIPKEIYQKLVDMATELLDEVNPTQMIKLTPELVISYLPSSLPVEWLNTSNQKVSWKPDSPGHPPEKWITDIWHWINDTFESLAQFEGIPLIPLDSNSEKSSLGVLRKNSRFIFKSDSSQNMQLPSEVVGLLEAAGCLVLPCSSSSLHVRHPDISSYIASALPTEVTLLLARSSMESAEEYIKNCSNNEKKALQKFFASCKVLSEEEKNVLCRLPFLNTFDGSYTAALVNGKFLTVASPKFKLPTDFNFHKANKIISSVELESLQLVRLLGLEPMEPADIFSEFLFPDIQAQRIYTVDETTNIMLWILERKCEIQNEAFLNDIKDLAFVCTRNKELKKPCDIYDPNDSVVADLFLEEGSKFPSEEFSKLISTLQELGLRTRDMITALDLLGVAERVIQLKHEVALKKVQALVTIFQEKPNFLQMNIHGDLLVSKLAELEWLPRAKKYPRGMAYPNFMHKNWYSSETFFYKPSELYRESHTLLVGTSAPILGIEMNDDVQDLLGIQNEVSVSIVVEHLKTAVNVWEEKKRSNPQYNDMLQKIYEYLSEVSPQENVSEAIEQSNLVNWIWHGSGFCSPKQMALEKDLPFEFRPPLFLLPNTLNDGGTLTNFFRAHGVREQFSEEDIIKVLAAIKEEHEEPSNEISPQRIEKDLKFCRSILEWLVHDGETLGQELREKVFIPVHSVENKLVLKECEKCTYCDQDWLKHGKTELDIPDDFHPIHDSIPSKLAVLLGVRSLSSCLLSSECIEFEQTGPYEPITLRIKNILKEYKEGVGIFKELIQNADDAGATTVKFLVDWRQGNTDSLFSPDMAQSQGPALWAFNNAVFTDKDFENINKLAGGTKVEDLSKIGRFGLGFNAVYHLTDVPSFISRNFLCVFDPNVNHISNHIRDKSRPGIRIDLAKNPRPLTAFADQFAPYNQVFGCKTTMNNGEKFHFQGTLFRFSFRTDGEAKKSEICDTVYNAAKVKEIVRTLQRSASLILLFTQNVTDVELHELGPTGNPQNTSLILSIKKEIRRNNPVSSYIKQCSEWWQNKLKQLPLDEAPSRLEQVEIVKRENPSSITDVKTSHENSCSWLVAYCTGKDRSIEFAEEEGQKDGLLPLAGAAALFQSNSNDCMTAKRIEGEAFCFLPLSISTGLPIHVNSSFAVRSNRDGIWEKTTAEENLESRWNDSLLQDAIPEAYFKLLFGLVDLSKKGDLLQFDKHFHDLWPRLANSRTSWMTLVLSFYTKLVQRDLKLFSSNGRWLGITDGRILGDELRKHEDDKIVKTLQSLGEYVFDLPSDVIRAMREVVDISVTVVLEKQTLSLVSFFRDFLFPNLHSISSDLRNPIVHRGLSYIFLQSTQDWEELESLYRETECIPCSPDGQKLARPCDLIDPNAETIAALYSPKENRFPFGELDDSQLNALRKLGMVNDLLSWKEISERAESIEAFNDKEKALRRSRFLIKYLRCNIERLKDKQGMSGSESLQEIQFLPVRLTPPASYTLPWKGAEINAIEFRCPNDLFLPKDVYLVGSSCLIVDDTDEESGCGSLQVLKNLLGFTRRPSCEQVLKQLEVTRDSNADDNVKNKVCNLVYHHLNYELAYKPDNVVIQKLKNITWLFVHGKFVENSKLALKWKGYAEPFLYHVPDNYQQEFTNLLELTGIKKIFTASDFLEALDSLWELKEDSSLAPEDVKLVVTLTNELKDNFDNSVKQRVGTIPLPDTQSVLCNSNDLTIPESFQVKYAGNERYIHSDINRNVALKLGAKPLRARRREKYGNTMSMSFGQFEKLTDRIKTILNSYPCDVGILKELVQNADDAKATEIQFIYDKRTLSHERVLQNNANEIQGPALCVYNNKFFSEEDFDGICKLGIGSKQDDAAKTGQYGIGFNAVYHLTDCPSFLSNDDILCILDPHCEYSPEATAEAPGGRYNNIDHDFRDIFSDTVSGYLGEFDKHFPLPGCTMFRLPLRTDEQGKKSEISNRPVTDKLMIRLIHEFRKEAKKLLLFLNHVKKIGLWEITKTSKLKSIYSVSSQLKPKYEKKLPKLHHHLQEYKKVKTCDVPIKDATYTISIQDTDKLKEKWLIHQRFGIKAEAVTDKETHESSGIETEAVVEQQSQASFEIKTDSTTTNETHQASSIINEAIKDQKMPESFGIKAKAVSDDETPNVCDLGLFPRGGIAALLPSSRACYEEYVAYCFLPLPVKTRLPVHVNGHFALDGSRRDLWFDTSATCRKTKWNEFMKTNVLGPSCASLITKARKHIPHCEKDSDKIYFSSKEDATKALHWYHELFPNPDADPKWEPLAVAAYQCLKESPVLPVVSQSRGIVTQKKDKQCEYRSKKSPDSKLLQKDKRTAPGSGRFRNASGKYSSHKPKYREFARESNSKNVKTARYAIVAERRNETPTIYHIEWLPPKSVYFIQEEDAENKMSKGKKDNRQQLLTTLLRIRMPLLLYTPLKIYNSLVTSKVECQLLAPENVIQFLLTSQEKSSRCNVGKLPIQLSISNIQNELSLQRIIEYCKKALKKTPQHLEGLPLLLTADSMLRVFTPESPVYCSSFSDLFPDKLSKFVHPNFVLQLLSFYTLEHDIIRDLTVELLAGEFMPDAFSGKLALGEKKHIQWKYPEKGVLSKSWFIRLWKFLESAAKSAKDKPIENHLGKYPIIPTTDGKLATIDNAKSVLVEKYGKKGNCLEQEVVEILESLTCPFLDESIIKEALSVVLPLVADPHCASDVLHVLDYMNSTGILDMSKFDEKRINILLSFFQTDCKNVTSMSIAKNLPFYKGVDEDYHSLSSYQSYVQIPPRLPDNGIKELQSLYYERRVLFLPISTNLNQLYTALGIRVDCSASQFYISYILPNFSSFSQECQIEFLANIKDTNMTDELKEKLIFTKCIPDQSRNLRVASSFFNPYDELFKVMLKSNPDVFPAAPFNEKQWIVFLIKIGLKKNCDERQFITFAKNVAESSQNLSEYDENIITQSHALVKYLKRFEHSKDGSFHAISQIEFIFPDKVESELTSLHAQYHVDGKLEFVSYRESVPWKYRNLVWTSAKLLPDWAYPKHEPRLVSTLGIPSKPPLEPVLEHVKIISKCSSEIFMSDSGSPENANNIIKVFKDVYDFLKGIVQNCTKQPLFSNCSQECVKIGKCLTSVPCILLSKEQCLVTGERLSFDQDVKEKLEPHFYVLPREYYEYEHLLKRLGVTEKITPLQMANVLQSIKGSCTKDTMNSKEEEKACFATSALFKSLLDDATEVESRLSNCEELMLPSMKKRLVQSNKLLCNMQPRLRESVQKQGYEILYPLEKCGLKRELEGDYLNSLPERLRPTPLSELVREELHPLCKINKTCIHCRVMDCPFIQKFILVLRSSQFERGILRLLKHQKETSTLEDEDRARASIFTSTKVSPLMKFFL